MEECRITLGFVARDAKYTLVAITKLREWEKKLCIWIWTS